VGFISLEPYRFLSGELSKIFVAVQIARLKGTHCRWLQILYISFHRSKNQSRFTADQLRDATSKKSFRMRISAGSRSQFVPE